MWFRNQQEIKMKFYYLKIILFLFYINIAHAASDNLTIPNTFVDGEIVSASKFNANFEAVKNKVNQLNLGKSIFFPNIVVDKSIFSTPLKTFGTKSTSLKAFVFL